MKYLLFDICKPDERSAGIIGFYDQIKVQVESGDPGGNPGEFAEHIKSALEEWYDGATVTIRSGGYL